MCNDLKKRVAMIKQFVQLAEACRNLRNFNALMAVLGGLNNAAVRRLKLTWAVRLFIYILKHHSDGISNFNFSLE